MLLFQCVKLDTQALIAAGNVSIQTMDGNAHWSVTVQKNIVFFHLDVWKSCPVSLQQLLYLLYSQCCVTVNSTMLHALHT